MYKWLLSLLSFLILSGCSISSIFQEPKKTGILEEKIKFIFFPEEKFPERADFIRTAYEKTKKEKRCTLDRAHAKEREKDVFKSLPLKKGYDRVAFPMTICKESETGAYVGYVNSKENREAEKWIQYELEKYPDGTQLMISLGKPPKLKKHIDEVPNNTENETK